MRTILFLMTSKSKLVLISEGAWGFSEGVNTSHRWVVSTIVLLRVL